MARVQIKAAKGDFQYLKELAQKFKSYLELFPPPLDEECVFELVPAKMEKRLFAWRWPNDTLTSKQDSWQTTFDYWLNQWFKEPFSDTIPGILIKIMKATDGECSDAKSVPPLIQGEGLASFSAVKPRFRMDDLVLPEELGNKICNTISILKNQKLIYETWGFAEVDPCPRAVLSFYGPPGTGKTMAAHCIAYELEKNIIVANFAEIESKFVGDSPKNLENIFTVAKHEDAVLFFDEADSFLGKRLTSISSSSDQAVNSLRSKLLQLLEEHTGLVIFCTNLLKNYDKAFESRILRSLKFELPDKDCRIKLIRKMIPAKVPFAPGQELSDAVLEELADLTDGFSGRELKNTVLQVLCKAAAEQKEAFTILDFKDGIASMKAELEAMKKERGEIDGERKKQIEKGIQEKLEKGDYIVKKADENPS